MKRKKIIIGTVILLVAVIVLWILLSKENKTVLSLSTIVIKRGNVVNTVTATGTVEPIDQIDVGTQVSGVIKKIYVDFNDVVKKGQLLAELDRSTLKAQLLQSQASLFSAENELKYREQNFNRTRKLFETQLVSETDYEQAEYQYNNAKTNVDQLRSKLEQTEVNLSYATIYSPIDGVILNRNVEEGQTVAASFSTPTLFSIAKDLTKMQVEADVDQADIGQVKVGQNVNFMVDAYPEDTFPGKVTQIRLQPTITSNVVTYTVIIEAPNNDLKLMPGLTANIEIVIKEANNVLLATPKALQFEPTEEFLAEYPIETPPDFNDKNIDRKKMDRPGGSIPEGNVNSQSTRSDMPVGMGMPSGAQQFGNSGENGPKFLWVKKGKMVQPRMVQTGMEDGARVEIIRGVNEEDTIITAVTKVDVAKANATQSRNPFMPRPPQRTRSAQRPS